MIPKEAVSLTGGQGMTSLPPRHRYKFLVETSAGAVSVDACIPRHLDNNEIVHLRHPRKELSGPVRVQSLRGLFNMTVARCVPEAALDREKVWCG